MHWDPTGADMDELSGPGQSTTLVKMGVLGDRLSYATVDDSVRSISMTTNEYRWSSISDTRLTFFSINDFRCVVLNL